MSEATAKVILDSTTQFGDRLTTVEVTFWRPILAEVNTHRTHSRNSASSRAIPVWKQIERVLTDLAGPISWTTEKPGMSGGPPLTGKEAKLAEEIWSDAATSAVESAELLLSLGVHKSITNRLLEPFMWHTAILTSTQAGWSNLFAQRCHPDAQPEFQAVAEATREAMDASEPAYMRRGEWHTPYVTDEEREYLSLDARCIISVARCCRVSYLQHDGTRDLSKDLALYHGTLDSSIPPHESPMEHVASPVEERGQLTSGNFDGWHQWRHSGKRQTIRRLRQERERKA